MAIIFLLSSGMTSSLFVLHQSMHFVILVPQKLAQRLSVWTWHWDANVFAFTQSTSVEESLLMQTQHFRKIQQNFCAGSFGNLAAFNIPHCTKSTITFDVTAVILKTCTLWQRQDRLLLNFCHVYQQNTSNSASVFVTRCNDNIHSSPLLLKRSE